MYGIFTYTTKCLRVMLWVIWGLFFVGNPYFQRIPIARLDSKLRFVLRLPFRFGSHHLRRSLASKRLSAKPTAAGFHQKFVEFGVAERIRPPKQAGRTWRIILGRVSKWFNGPWLVYVSPLSRATFPYQMA